MKPSNTYRNSSALGGVLEPLLKSLTRPQQIGVLSGQEVVLGGKDVTAILALDSENDVHLLISPDGIDDDQLKAVDLRGMKVTTRDWSVSAKAPQRYLDVACGTGLQPHFKRPFLRFAEDILLEISLHGVGGSEAIARTYRRWKKFWTLENKSYSEEWARGLAGELSFLKYLIGRVGGNATNCWNGPLGAVHDFLGGTSTAFEVKTSSKLPYSVRCNLRQLDTDVVGRLFLVSYLVTEATFPNGLTIIDLVNDIESVLGEDDAADVFRDRLAEVGYRRDQEDEYREHRLQIGEPTVFLVDNSFPRVVEKSFSPALDHRISEVKYTVTLTGLQGCGLDDLAGGEFVPFRAEKP